MPIYHTDELSFEVADGFEDKTLNLFVPAPSTQPKLTITIAREPRTEDSLGGQVGKFVKQLEKSLRDCRILGQRDTTVGNLSAREVRAQGMQDRVPIYQRQAHVGWFGTMVTLCVTTSRSATQKCDAATDAILKSIRFRKPV